MVIPATAYAQPEPQPEPQPERAPETPPAETKPSPEQEEARSRFNRALELADDGQFDAALVELSRAYELSPSYRLLYNIGVVHQQLKDYARALDTFERYLAEGKDDVPAARREDVNGRMERLRGRVGFLDVRSTEPGAEVSIDDRPVGKTPLPPVRVNSGQRKITVTVTGRAPQSRILPLAGGETREVSFDFTIVTAPPPPPPPPPQTKISIAPLVGWGATLVLAGGALGTGVVTLGKSSDYDKEAGKFGVKSDDLASAKSDVTTFAILTDVLIGATVVAAGVSTYLTISSARKKTGSATSVRVGLGAGTAALSGSF